MRIEGRHLIDLGHGDSQLFAKRLHMTSRQAPFCILDKMQIFYQHIALTRGVPQQFYNRFGFFAFKQPPLGKDRRLAPARTRMDAAFIATVRQFIHVFGCLTYLWSTYMLLLLADWPARLHPPVRLGQPS